MVKFYANFGAGMRVALHGTESVTPTCWTLPQWGPGAPGSWGPVPVEKLWPDSTIVCIGSGPSLTRADVDYCRGKARVIAIKNVVEMAPWADVLYGAGADRGGTSWWNIEGPRLTFTGLRYTLDPQAKQWASVLTLIGEQGLCRNPSGLAGGGHSGYQALNLAVHLGATKIVLLGYDLQTTGGQDHYFGKHPHGRTPPFALFLHHFPSIVAPLAAAGVEVINASRETALTIFPRMNIDEALS